MDGYNAITFFDAYVEAALWSSTDNSRPDGGDPLDQHFVPADVVCSENCRQDIDAETREKMRADCQRFQEENADLLTRYYSELPTKVWKGEAQAGHDFWLSRNGHGCGFFDREVSHEVIDALQAKAEAYGQYDLYIGDDGKIYGQGVTDHTTKREGMKGRGL